MCFHFNLLKSYWAEALNTINNLQNRSPTKALDDKTPFESWSRIKPTLTHIKIFDYKTYTLIPKENKQKLNLHSIKCIFLSYIEESKTYMLMDISNIRIIISKGVIFDETPTYAAHKTIPPSLET
jgi:hypothetical protein